MSTMNVTMSTKSLRYVSKLVYLEFTKIVQFFCICIIYTWTPQLHIYMTVFIYLTIVASIIVINAKRVFQTKATTAFSFADVQNYINNQHMLDNSGQKLNIDISNNYIKYNYN